ncbi:mycothiol acetyltransferase-like [Saccoglossus kowalevskii]|uniref:Diamine acetyltransferase 1-like n=1 Tax=Saccoglossus kowalevskii TaxID=10224 RepID=A0ABM0LVS3_SACKO|nr:PREDICTED: diamine acetyltransferase 1-like [Saccoglossus kowalevskii]
MCCKLGCIASCGLCCMHCVLNEPVKHTGECYINHICVDSNYRGKGIGKFLLQYGESEAKRLGCTRMTLYVAETNRAKNLYERQGYVVTNNEDGWLFTYCAVGVRRWCKMDKVIQ